MLRVKCRFYLRSLDLLAKDIFLERLYGVGPVTGFLCPDLKPDYRLHPKQNLEKP